MRILFIDDDAGITAYFCQAARAHGQYDSESVASSEEAINKVLRQSYDLITLDINMPGISGLEIIAMLRDMNPHAVIAVISGFIPAQLPDQVLSCVDVLVPKPIDVEILSQLFEAAVVVSNTIESVRNLGLSPPVGTVAARTVAG